MTLKTSIRNKVELHRLTSADLELVLAWRRLLPENATESTTIPSWADHQAWYEDNSHTDYLIWYGNRRVGIVGINRSWLSIHIAEPELRGLGIAKDACNLALEMLEGYTYCYAKVHYGNLPSRKLFESLGFSRLIQVGTDTGSMFQTWRKDLNGD